jgi:tetraacyldisaccharide 4'-kinase
MAARPRFVSALPVVCVGNFTAGGAGKTPVTALIARRLRARGHAPAVLTRGYGGTTRGPRWVDPTVDGAATVGDEPLLHARIVPTMVARDRVAGARAIEAYGGADVIVMDDGLQNARLGKTLSIAVVDGARGLGNRRVIPAGPVRAPLAVQAGLVDAIVLNGPATARTQRTLDRLVALAGSRGRELPILLGRLVPAPAAAAALAGARVVAFAGIGDPARFFTTLAEIGAEVVATVPYPDHAAYTAADARQLTAMAERLGAHLVTTEKDHVRLAGSDVLDALAAASSTVAVEMQLEPTSEAMLDLLLRRATAATGEA